MYSVGSLAFLLISFVCYWAYGNGIEPNVIQNLSGPSWAVALAYIAGAAQIVVSFHVSALPCQITNQFVKLAVGANTSAHA